MTDIYVEISKLSDKFKEMCYGITFDKNEIEEVVQELMLYFMQMNPETLKKIYKKDGIEGILKYGAVAIRRALTSKRSNYYYKYKKYYSHIDSFRYNSSDTITDGSFTGDSSYYKDLSNLPNQEIDDYQWKKLEEIDKALEDFNWYDKKVFELYYYESNTLDSLAEKTMISRNSLFTTIDKVRTLLKKKLNDE